jgi:hypothetical protein
MRVADKAWRGGNLLAKIPAATRSQTQNRHHVKQRPTQVCQQHPFNCEKGSANVSREELIAPYVPSHPGREVPERISRPLHGFLSSLLIIAIPQPLVGQQLKPCPWAS